MAEAPKDPPQHLSLSALSHALVTTPESLEQALRGVAVAARDVMSGCGSASVTLLERGKPTTVAFTDEEIAIPLDQAQYDARTGPCLHCIEVEVPVRVPDMSGEHRWTAFSTEALAHGIRSSLSMPLLVNDEGVGALNLYGTVVDAFDDDDLATGRVLASQAAVTVANAAAYWSMVTLSQNLNVALQSRAVIEQAKGMLMAREGISADEAFDVLRRASQRANRKLRDIATDIVAGTGLP